MPSKPEGNSAGPVHVEVAATSSGTKKYHIEKHEMTAEPLSAIARFPLHAVAFCAMRTIRLVLLEGVFPDGPHKEDVGAQFGIACAWLSMLAGIFGAILMHAPLREWVKLQDVPPWVRIYWEPSALGLLAAAVFIDVFHQLLALARWNYFWSIGVIGEDKALHNDYTVFIAHMLVMLHVAGLLGMAIIIGAYARCYRAAWRQLGDRRVAAGDLGDGLRGGADEEAGRGAGVGSSQPDRSNVYGTSEVNPAGVSKPSAPTPPSGLPPRVPSKNTSGTGNADGDPSRGPRHAPEAPPHPPEGSRGYTPRGSRTEGNREPSPDAERGFAGDAERRTGTPTRAWLWANDEWVRVRIIRSTSDGTASVRLSGGIVVHTRQHLLRPRGSDDDEPPRDPLRQPQSRPSSASASANAGPQEPRGPSLAARADSACAKPQTPNAENDSEGALWAAARLVQLQKELIELDKLEAAEKRVRLRSLQRELHPDKQPPDLRVHVQPLFHLVQREWEVDEAARGASKGG